MFNLPGDTSTPSNLAQQGFSFFTNYAQVLLLIASTSDIRMRQLASEIGITERAIQRIIEDLHSAGYLEVKKRGRRNQYEVKSDLPLRRELMSHRTVGEFVRFIQDPKSQDLARLAS